MGRTSQGILVETQNVIEGESVRNNRKRVKASGIYKIEPLFRDPDTRMLVVGDTTHYIDGRLGEHLVVSVPETTTQAAANDLEHRLTELAKKSVLIVTHNMAFLRATLLTGKEAAELGKIIEQAENKVVVPSGTEVRNESGEIIGTVKSALHPTPPSDGTPFGKGN